MSAQKGKDVLLKIGDGGGPETFTTIGGLRSKSIALTAGTVDVTDSESPGAWRELLAGAGVRTASLSGAGVFRDDAAAEMVRSAFFTHIIRNWQIIIPDFGTIEGPFQITNLDYAGEFDGEATHSVTLESAGALSFTAV